MHEMRNVEKIPTNKPLLVFPELIEGISFLPPIILPPKYENVSNNHITIIISIIFIVVIDLVIFIKIKIKMTLVTKIKDIFFIFLFTSFSLID